MKHEVTSREAWLEARRALLAKERAHMKQGDQLNAELRALPWVKLEKSYTFDGPSGTLTLSDLFAGRSQLFVKHHMLGPGQQHHCVGCALEVDHLQGILVHLQNHDLSYVAIARAPIEEIEALRQRMGWQFPFVSSYRSDFNYDFHVSFTPEAVKEKKAFYNFRESDPGVEDLSGDSVFYKDEDGDIFHTYSAFARGCERFLGIYDFLDVSPKGRNEHGPYHGLTDWARPHDMYGKGGTIEPIGRYHAQTCTCSMHR
ncbi:DUF899 domain-containing protein [Dyella caseinilytica]|uniref:DUF899 domain-containing protein n=1 Tax=Dyella caseinilytica TaxID=1849581 RepID=A0ABX7GW14_9GAMM|nr:thioredoxin family protein [Dyella caseinilytica]QRN54480.1 DUF899 domain-containing protein [Dyella caseinilytica]GFZ94552.1 hypothetical protein GCM10011408_13120 [Dyella caseinilytica]